MGLAISGKSLDWLDSCWEEAAWTLGTPDQLGNYCLGLVWAALAWSQCVFLCVLKCFCCWIMKHYEHFYICLFFPRATLPTLKHEACYIAKRSLYVFWFISCSGAIIIRLLSQWHAGHLTTKADPSCCPNPVVYSSRLLVFQKWPRKLMRWKTGANSQPSLSMKIEL